MARIRNTQLNSESKEELLVGAYIRLSKEDEQKMQKDSESVSNQKSIIEDYVKREFDTVVSQYYVDDGITGIHFIREDFQRMETDIQDKKINCIVVKDLSRFGRSHRESDNYILELFPKYGVRFIAVNDAYDSQRDGYSIIVPFKNLINEQYSRDISMKVMSALESKKRKGHFTGSFASYGYQKSDIKGKLEIDSYASEIVKQIFSLFIEGKGKKSIAKILNHQGIQCPSEYKKACGERYQNSNKLETTSYWTYSSINKILHNQIYAGDMVQGKSNRSKFNVTKTTEKEKSQWIIAENTHEPIIDRDTWNTVQELLEKDTRVIDFNQSLSCFAGFLKCADCGRAMTKINDKGHVYYVCGSYRAYGKSVCSSHHISHEVVEDAVLDDINTVLESIKDLQKDIKQISKNKERQAISKEKDLRKLDAEISNLQKKKRRAYEDYQDGILSKQEYFDIKDEYQKSIDFNLQKKLSLQEAKQENEIDLLEKPWIKNLLEKGKLYELDRITVVQTINHIRIGENKEIFIDYKFSKELENLFQKR